MTLLDVYRLLLNFDERMTFCLWRTGMDLNTLGEPDRIPWRMHGCFHNAPYAQVETVGNHLRKHGCMHHFQQLSMHILLCI